MKRGLFLLATVTLSSALYAQHLLTPEQARQIIRDFNPQLFERAAQQPEVSTLMEELVSSYLAQQPADDLAGRYGLIALARNFDNSLALYQVTQQYEDAVRYDQLGGTIEQAARQHAQEELRGVWARIWAVSVQTKQDLLSRYTNALAALRQDDSLPAEQKTRQVQALAQTITALQADIKNLQTDIGPQLNGLMQNTLGQARARVLAEQTALRENSNLQIKTKHKKPVAE